MARISTDLQKSQSDMLTNVSTENRTLREVLHNSKRIGGNYGSLAQSKLQPTFYILHKVNSDDTLQRLALRYGINVGIFLIFLCFVFSLVSIEDSRNQTS